ncbi:hypothetical protein BOW53_01135 [Solemya pervernicosa gill symbiont]|uniref:Cytochrome C oxidase subunit IV n=2 Tax=Gammaproteobacteria incertae sedis TaxID=118884 RepID=A0A1T2LAT6_9GAMM|nr:hypothetical protein BOW53_01135 [Solemya pervernicosa gill symbiont]
MSILKPRPCTVIWLLLMVLTLITYSAAPFGLSSQQLVLAVLLIALLKAQLVVDFFMGVRHARAGWRLLMGGYLLLLGALITSAFLLTTA